jgi:hypothetical protein
MIVLERITPSVFERKAIWKLAAVARLLILPKKGSDPNGTVICKFFVIMWLAFLHYCVLSDRAFQVVPPLFRRDGRVHRPVILTEFFRQGARLSMYYTSLSRNLTILRFCLLVLISRFGHQRILLNTAFNNPWLDPARPVANFIASNLLKSMLVNLLTQVGLRGQYPLRN